MAPYSPQEPQNGPSRASEPEIRIIDPHPALKPVSDEECWQQMSDADIQLLGLDREGWEKQFTGNPCQKGE